MAHVASAAFIALLLSVATPPVSARVSDLTGEPSAGAGGVPQIELDAPVRLRAGDGFIDTGRYVAHAGPLLFDIDRDGKTDLLVGTFTGQILVFRNIGTGEQPVFVDEGPLEADGEAVKLPNW